MDRGGNSRKEMYCFSSFPNEFCFVPASRSFSELNKQPKLEFSLFEAYAYFIPGSFSIKHW